MTDDLLPEVFLTAAQRIHADKHMGMCDAAAVAFYAAVPMELWDKYLPKNRRMVDFIELFRPERAARGSYWGQWWSSEVAGHYDAEAVRECRTLALLFMSEMAKENGGD